MYLIDTNIISEVRKGPRCDARVGAWYATIADADIYLSVLTLGEIRKGIDLARRKDPRKAEELVRWLRRVESSFRARILPVDGAAAQEWGRMSAIRPVPVIDGLLAATAKTSGLTFVTRDAEAVADLGAAILDPFSSKPQ